MPALRHTLHRLGRACRNFATSDVGLRAAAGLLAARDIGFVALGDQTCDAEHCDAILESASDGMWSRTTTGEASA